MSLPCYDLFHQYKEGHLGSISQSNKIHRKTNFQYYHSNLYCDITLSLATTIDLQLRSILALSGNMPCNFPFPGVTV